MKIIVMMPTGDEEEWHDALDASVSPDGYLHVLDSASESSDSSPAEQPAMIRAVYPPGGWIRVEFDRES